MCSTCHDPHIKDRCLLLFLGTLLSDFCFTLHSSLRPSKWGPGSKRRKVMLLWFPSSHFITFFPGVLTLRNIFLIIPGWYIDNNTIPKSISYPEQRFWGLCARTRRSVIGVPSYLIGFKCQIMVFPFAETLNRLHF